MEGFGAKVSRAYILYILHRAASVLSVSKVLDCGRIAIFYTAIVLPMLIKANMKYKRRILICCSAGVMLPHQKPTHLNHMSNINSSDSPFLQYNPSLSTLIIIPCSNSSYH